MSGRRGMRKNKSVRGIKSRSLSPVSRNADKAAPKEKFFKTGTWQIIDMWASSHDPEHPPTAVAEKNNNCWSSTGLYPQMFNVTLSVPVLISELTLKCIGIGEISLRGRAVRNMPFKEVIHKKFVQNRDEVIQVFTASLEKAGPIEQMRLVILSGFSSFCAIKQLSLNGQAGRGVMTALGDQIAIPVHKRQKPTRETIDVGSIKGNIVQRSPAAPMLLKPVYSTFIQESDIIMQPIGLLWDIVSKVDFSCWMQNVRSMVLSSGPSVTTTNSLITIKYVDGSSWMVRLVAIDEEKHFITWELVASQEPMGYTSRIDTLTLTRCTKENWTLVEWNTDFSSDATLAVIEDARHKRLEAFDHLEAAVLKIA